MDIVGPFVPDNFTNGKYFILFTDDYSRFSVLYLMATKNQAAEMLNKFIAEYCHPKALKLECLRSDNDPVFTSQEFSDLCKLNKIQGQFSCTYSPHQNGLAERHNRVILDIMRCMMLNSGLPRHFWGFAAIYSCYIKNRLPSAPINFQIPYEKFTGLKPDLSMARVFGCKAFVHNVNTLTKLDARAVECIFVGICQDRKAYKLVDNANNVIHSFDVIFAEDSFSDIILQGNPSSTGLTISDNRQLQKDIITKNLHWL
jgi:hypothetical protein